MDYIWFLDYRIGDNFKRMENEILKVILCFFWSGWGVKDILFIKV